VGEGGLGGWCDGPSAGADGGVGMMTERGAGRREEYYMYMGEVSLCSSRIEGHYFSLPYGSLVARLGSVWSCASGCRVTFTCGVVIMAVHLETHDAFGPRAVKMFGVPSNNHAEKRNK